MRDATRLIPACKIREGIEIMCQAMEDMRNQTLKEGMINVAFW